MSIPGDWTYQNIADMRAQSESQWVYQLIGRANLQHAIQNIMGQQQSMFIDMMSKGIGLSQKCRRELGSS